MAGLTLSFFPGRMTTRQSHRVPRMTPPVGLDSITRNASVLVSRFLDSKGSSGTRMDDLVSPEAKTRVPLVSSKCFPAV